MGAVKAWAVNLQLMPEYIEGWAAFDAGLPRPAPANYSGDEASAYELGHDDAYWYHQPEPDL